VSEFVAYLTVLVAAAIPWLEVLLVVPAGIVAGLPAVPTAAVAAVGNVATLVPLVLGGDRLRGWWRRRRCTRRAEDVTGGDPPAGDVPASSTRSGRATRLFERYGLPGLAALGPLLTGVHVAAIVALAAGADRRRTVLWLTGGVVVWAAIAAVAAVVGIEALFDPDDLPDLGIS
jgi:Ca2+/H+ antiporter, TMEM165/GDT1 family